MAEPTVLARLMNAAPMIVPAMPSRDAVTAPVRAASMLAAA